MKRVAARPPIPKKKTNYVLWVLIGVAVSARVGVDHLPDREIETEIALERTLDRSRCCRRLGVGQRIISRDVRLRGPSGSLRERASNQTHADCMTRIPTACGALNRTARECSLAGEEETMRKETFLPSGSCNTRRRRCGRRLRLRVRQKNNQLDVGIRKLARYIRCEVACAHDGLPRPAALAQAEILIIQLQRNGARKGSPR